MSVLAARIRRGLGWAPAVVVVKVSAGQIAQEFGQSPTRELWAYAGRLADVPIGPLVGDPADWNWCGHDWTAWAPISATSGYAVGTDTGIFPISGGDGTLICVGWRVGGVGRAPSGARVKGHVGVGG